MSLYSISTDGQGFNASGSTTLSTSTSTSRVALPSTGPTVTVLNGGSVTAYVALGDVTVVATTSNTPVLAGQTIILSVGLVPATYIAGITGSSTASLTVTTGEGVPLIVDAGVITVTPSGTQDVNLTKVAGASVATGAGTAAGTIRVELPTDGTGKVGLNAGSAIVGKFGIDQTTPGTTNAVSATPVKSATVTNTQVTVPATANGILILASNANRLGAIISNPGSVAVYWQQAATGVTTSNGGIIPAGGSLNIDTPLYTGAIYGIVATSTQVVSATEFTA